MTSAKLSIVQVDRLELAFAPRPWPFAEQRGRDIGAFFAGLKREKPAVWNGRVLLLHEGFTIADGIFRGAFLETDFASFTAWRDWDCPPASVMDCFGAAAIVSTDGAILLGVMGAHTVNAGRAYFPSGTPDPSDIVGDQVDLKRSVRRELEEETGLTIAEFEPEPGWCTVIEGALIAHIKFLRAREDAATLRRRVIAHLAREQQPELADIRIVRGPADIEPTLPLYVRTFLAQRWR